MSHECLHGKNSSRFDLILDLASQKPDFYMKLLKKNGRGKFVTLTGPLLRNLDQYGLPMGVAVTAANAGIKVVQVLILCSLGMKHLCHVFCLNLP